MFETPAERNWIIWTGVVILAITTLPYIIAYSQYSNQIFSGMLIGVEDGNSYIAKMRLGAEGAWLFRSPYTTAEQKGFLAFLPYMMIGKFTSGPGQHDQLVFLFHAFRWVAGLFLTLVTYIFCAQFFKRVALRRIATIIILIGGGSGWIALFDRGNVLFNQPLEFYSPETFGFLSLFGLPHLLAARAFLLLGFIFFFKEPHSTRFALAGGVCWFLCGFFQPLTIATGWAYVAAMILLRWLYDAIKNRGKGLPDWKLQTTLRATAVMVAVSAPWVIYNLVMFSTDAYLRGWASQNLIISPPWQDYLISFLIILPFAAWGAVRLLQNKSSLYAFFPASVMMVFPLLAYAPFNMQRRLPDGIWLALVIAGFSLFENRKNNAQRGIPFALMAISLLTPVIILAGAFQAIRTPGQPIYQPEVQVTAFEYLGASAPAGSVVLAAYETSNALPAWAAVRVVAGLGPESVYFDSAVGDVNLFFSGNLSGESQTEMLRKYSVDYVFYGPQERRLGDWNPADSTYLQKVYERDGYAIYTVFLNDDNK